jgi:hypothetical protein
MLFVCKAFGIHPKKKLQVQTSAAQTTGDNPENASESYSNGGDNTECVICQPSCSVFFLCGKKRFVCTVSDPHSNPDSNPDLNPDSNMDSNPDPKVDPKKICERTIIFSLYPYPKPDQIFSLDPQHCSISFKLTK